MKQDEQRACFENFAKYLEECGLTGKTLDHYPTAVDNYIPKYIRKYINPDFECFYDLKAENVRAIYEQLVKSNYWIQDIKYKTWKVRLKAIEYYVSYIEKQEFK